MGRHPCAGELLKASPPGSPSEGPLELPPAGLRQACVCALRLQWADSFVRLYSPGMLQPRSGAASSSNTHTLHTFIQVDFSQYTSPQGMALVEDLWEEVQVSAKV